MISILPLKVGVYIANQDLDILGDLTIRDRAINFNFDFEGTKTKPIIFLKEGKLITPAYDLFTAKKEKCKSTGHGGLNGVSIRDLYIESPDNFTNPRIDKITENRNVLLINDINIVNNDLRTGHMILSICLVQNKS